MGYIFLIGDFAEQEAALKVEKSWVPSNNLAPFFNNFKSIFLLICHALFLLIDKAPCLLIIKYSYVRNLALNLAWKFSVFSLISNMEINFSFKKKLIESRKAFLLTIFFLI